MDLFRSISFQGATCTIMCDHLGSLILAKSKWCTAAANTRHGGSSNLGWSLDGAGYEA